MVSLGSTADHREAEIEAFLILFAGPGERTPQGAARLRQRAERETGPKAHVFIRTSCHLTQ